MLNLLGIGIKKEACLNAKQLKKHYTKILKIRKNFF